MEFTIDQSFDRWLYDQQVKLVARIADEMTTELRAGMPRRTGALIASVNDLPGTNMDGEPYVDVRASYIETFQNPSHKIYHPSTKSAYGMSRPVFGFGAALDVLGGRQL